MICFLFRIEMSLKATLVRTQSDSPGILDSGEEVEEREREREGEREREREWEREMRENNMR